jgi:hypothetical protein
VLRNPNFLLEAAWRISRHVFRCLSWRREEEKCQKKLPATKTSMGGLILLSPSIAYYLVSSLYIWRPRYPHIFCDYQFSKVFTNTIKKLRTNLCRQVSPPPLPPLPSALHPQSLWLSSLGPQAHHKKPHSQICNLKNVTDLNYWDEKRTWTCARSPLPLSRTGLVTLKPTLLNYKLSHLSIPYLLYIIVPHLTSFYCIMLYCKFTHTSASTIACARNKQFNWFSFH